MMNMILFGSKITTVELLDKTQNKAIKLKEIQNEEKSINNWRDWAGWLLPS